MGQQKIIVNASVLLFAILVIVFGFATYQVIHSPTNDPSVLRILYVVNALTVLGFIRFLMVRLSISPIAMDYSGKKVYYSEMN